MERRFNRRSLIKGATGASALVATKQSSVFAAPSVIKQTGSKVTVTYWGSFSDALGEAEQEVVRMFNESQQDVELQYQFQGTYEETAQKLTAALAANQAPDISLLSDVWWFKFYINNAIAPMNDFIAANEIDTTDYVDSLYIEGVRNDQVFWLPFARSTPLFYYNKEAFAEAGLDGPPTKWSEFAEVAPSLVKKDDDTITQSAFAHPNAGSYVAWLFQGVDWAWGGSYSDADFNITIDQGPSVDAGNFYRSTVADGWAMAVADQVQDFVNGLTASTLASTGGLAGITENAQFEFGTAFLPEEVGFGCSTGGAGLAILANSPREKQEAAFKYIAFATSPEITTFWSQNTGYMPVRKSAVESQSMQDFFAENPNFKVAVNQLPKTKPQDAARVFIPGGDQIIGKGLEQITINLVDAQTAFDDVAAQLEEEAGPVKEALAAM